MTAPDEGGAESAGRGRVLVAAPFRRDAALVQEMLGRYGIEVVSCVDPAAFAAS
jgi:hypothetical protein